MMRFVHKSLSKFRRSEEGVALVEFALFLPLFVLSLYVIIEFSRSFFAYQGAVVGVRDATRYAARTFDPGLCVGELNDAGATVSVGTSAAPDLSYSIVERNLEKMTGSGILPANVEIVSVSTSYRCVVPAAGTYRQAEVPIARVFAQIRITLPLAGILELNGGPLIPNILTDIADESRVFGV